MIILKPTAAHIDPANHYTTNLVFDGGVVKPFYMRGSIAWPEGGQEGFALLAGYDLSVREIIIFKEFRFFTYEHWLNGDGSIHERDGDDPGFHIGLIQFFQDNLTKYKATSYFWGGQHIDIWTRWGTEIFKHRETSRRLEIIEVPYVAEIGDGLILEKLKTKKFKGNKDSLLEKSVVQFMNMQKAGGDVGSDNAVQALRALLAGFEYAPWVELKRMAA